MKKRWLSLLLASLTLGVGVACDGTANYEEKAPTYASDKEFYIGMWVGVPSVLKTYDEDGRVIGTSAPLTEADYDNHYKLIFEAGFNYVEPGLNEFSEAYNIQILKAAQKYNLNQYLNDYEIRSLLLDTTQDEATVETKLNNLAAKYMAYDSFAGLKITDEPSFDRIASYSIGKQRFDKVFGEDKIFYINLLPVIAGPLAVTANYQDYIREYVEKIGTHYVSYDYYPLKTNAKEENYVLEHFLYNMEQVKAAAPDKKIWTFLQSIKYSPDNRTLTSVADATFQVYSFLAYGGEGIQWFTYWSPRPRVGSENFGEGCIGRNGEKTEIYDYVKTANLELRSLEDIYFNFDWKGVMTTIGSEGEGGWDYNFASLRNTIENHERISIEAQRATLTGVFKDKKGRDGFMIVNFTEPSAKLKNKVELTLKNTSRAIVVKKGVQDVVDVNNGKLSFTMDEGEGYFVIPLR